MRDDFAVFILTHGRADNVSTMGALKKGGYAGKWYMVVDDEDDQRSLYEKNYGKDHVIVFDKQAAYDRTDSMDNFNCHEAIVYARNECWRIAADLGLTYFLMLDDDYVAFEFRYPDKGKLLTVPVRNVDRVFETMLEFLDTSGAAVVAMFQGGDYIGGARSPHFKEGLIIRKVMNTFFCRTDRPIDFRGTMNEDVVAYTTLGSRGVLFFSVGAVDVVQKSTQSLKGGMTDVYMDGGTYLKSFYAVMSMPSAVSAGMIYPGHKRVHHHVEWGRTVPKILNEKWRKDAK